MVTYHVLTFLLLFALFKSFDNIEFCQKMAIKDCLTTNLGEIVQALDKRTGDQKFEKCEEVQVRLIEVNPLSNNLFSFLSPQNFKMTPTHTRNSLKLLS